MLHQIVVVLMINFTKLSQNIFDRGLVDISGSDLHKKNREIENNSYFYVMFYLYISLIIYKDEFESLKKKRMKWK